MKLLIILSIFSFKAFAQTAVEYPTIDFPPKISIQNICTTGQTLRTIKPVEVCEELAVVARAACRQADQEICRPLKQGQQPFKFEELKEEVKCVRFSWQHFETNREFQITECAKWSNPLNPEQGHSECLTWVKIAKKHPEIYSLRLIRTDGDQGYRVTAVQNYALPACQ